MNLRNLRVFISRRFNIPHEHTLKRVLHSFTIAEKAVFTFFAIIFAVSGVFITWKVSDAFLVEIPTLGGSLAEGVVGNPRFINPVLAISEADRNLTSLIYSGPVRLTETGEVVNDLAESVIISEDRLTYTVKLNSNARFHDGEPVTADDLIFTVGKITDPLIKSPKRGNWEGVVMNKVDSETVTFTLKQAYTPFIYNLAIGVLPKHIWKNVSDDEFSFSQFNTLPVGSGPYQVESVERNSGGIPNYYHLTSFRDATGKAPYIRNFTFRFYPSEQALIDAYNSGDVESLSGLSPDKLAEIDSNDSRIISSPLPRVFAVFFNQNKSKLFLNKEVRQALELASPKEKIVEEILNGYGFPIDSPLPAGTYEWASERLSTSTPEERLESAKAILSKAGWKMSSSTGMLEKKSKTDTMTLSFSISTGDAPELQKVANTLAEDWRKLGAKVEILVFETGDLNQNIIRPRNFDALLFGEVIGRNADLYPFWHSSQRTDPGLNIALYANSRADTLLANARSAGDFDIIEKNYKAFAEEIETDVPAVFLYTPSFLYVVPEKVENVNLSSMTVSQDRFLGVRNWYIETDKVWKIFVNPDV